MAWYEWVVVCGLVGLDIAAVWLATAYDKPDRQLEQWPGLYEISKDDSCRRRHVKGPKARQCWRQRASSDYYDDLSDSDSEESGSYYYDSAPDFCTQGIEAGL